MVETSPLLSKAGRLAQEAHEGQFRAEGLPYFTHPVEVARILHEEWKIDDENILCAAVLHDVVEDTDITLDEIRVSFGEDIAKLVDGVLKFRSENGDKAFLDRETVRKVFDRTLIDPRVAVLRSADRLHNMRTLESMPRDKQLAKSRETLSVYSKLAESLGMWIVMKELEDLSFKYLNITEYEKWKERLENDPRNSDLFIGHTVSSLEAIVRESDVNASVEVRRNTLWRLRQKSEKIPRFRDINDVVSFRVIVDDSGSIVSARDNCYKLLGRFREAYLEDEDYDRFRDYYVRKRDNNYSAIQITIDTPNGAVEIAITSSSREEFNNWGVVSLLKKGQKELSEHALKLVFTPTGQVKFFQKEATGVDFAYSISSGLGAQAVGLIVDGEKNPLSVVIPNGAVIEVIVGEQRIAPDAAVQEYSLPATERIIKEQLANVEKENKIVEGKKRVEKILTDKGLLNLADLFSFEEHKLKVINLLYHLGCKGSLDSLYYLVGAGLVSSSDINKELNLNGITKNKLGLSSIRIEGIDEPGILEMVGAMVKQTGGNIGAIDLNRSLKDGNKKFSLRLVVENLNNKSEKLFDKLLHEDPRVKEVLIV